MATEWSKEQLEEMFGDDVIEQLAFLSGCIKHSYCDPKNPDLNGYIVSHEKLTEFALLIVKECMEEVMTYQHHNNPTREMVPFIVEDIKLHFGVKE